MKTPVEKYFGITPVDGIRYSKGPPVGDPASWNLPASIPVVQSGSVGVRQYLNNGAGLTINVTGLPTGVTYNAGTESLVGAASGTSTGTATFTAGALVDTASVSLVAPAEGFVSEAGFSVTGTFAHGANITITDASSRFGSHPMTAWMAGGDGGWIESHAGDGSVLVAADGWTRGSSCRTVIDAGRGKIIYGNQQTASGNALGRYTAEAADGAWQYASYWVRRHARFSEGTTTRGQMKTIGFSHVPGNSTEITTRLYFWQGAPPNDTNPSSGSLYWLSRVPSSYQLGNYSCYHSAAGSPRDPLSGLSEWPWVRLEFEAFMTREGAANEALGCRRVRLRMPGSPVKEETLFTYNGRQLLGWNNNDTANNWNYRATWWQDYFGNGYAGSQCEVWRDDLYTSANTRSRVEIANHATDFAAADVVEIQGLVSWSANQIVFKCNLGGLDSLVGRQLYVPLDDGTVLNIGQFQ